MNLSLFWSSISYLVHIVFIVIFSVVSCIEQMSTFTDCVSVFVNMMSALQFSVAAFFGYSDILFLRLVAPNQFSSVFSLNSFIKLLNSFSFLLKSP